MTLWARVENAEKKTLQKTQDWTEKNTISNNKMAKKY